jgi:S-adenosylmethionine synthetase
MFQKLVTCESVTEGHPDKVSDKISDSILDAVLEHDKTARVAVEVAVNTGLVLVFGEITTNTYVDITKIVRSVIRDIGYVDSDLGFDSSAAVLIGIDSQSSDIAKGVDKNLPKENSIGAGDQGTMFGFATNETSQMMPLPLILAHKLAKRLEFVRKNSIINDLLPDGKTQVTVLYEGDVPKKVSSVVVSQQHRENVSHALLQSKIKKHVVDFVLQDVENTLDTSIDTNDYDLYVNHTGKFVAGGPKADSGLTGRKIIVDTYGSVARHGGGAFSGKDPTKVDRSVAYYLRYIAKNIVAAQLADKVEIQSSYVIAKPEPLAVSIDTFGTNKIPEENILEIINKVFDFRVASVIESLNLLNVKYAKTAVYGHFGRDDLNLPWEKTDKVQEIKKNV